MTRIKRQRFVDAVAASGGIVSEVSRRLNVSRQAVYKRLQDPEFKAMLDEAREVALDRAESKLQEKILEGDVSAIKFYLQTIGKHRGYTTRAEISADVNGIGTVSIFLPHNNRDEFIEEA